MSERRGLNPRNEGLYNMYCRGDTYASIGAQYSITGSRVRDICMKGNRYFKALIRYQGKHLRGEFSPPLSAEEAHNLMTCSPFDYPVVGNPANVHNYSFANYLDIHLRRIG